MLLLPIRLRSARLATFTSGEKRAKGNKDSVSEASSAYGRKRKGGMISFSVCVEEPKISEHI